MEKNLVRIINIDLKNRSEKIKKIGTLLRNGKIIVFPTDTVYGIGCDPFNIHAIKKIYELKRREDKKGLPVLIGTINKLKNFAFSNKRAEVLIENFWPGSLTLILKKKNKVPKLLTGNKDSIAIRHPNNKITMAIAEEISSGGIVGTSANISGETPPIEIIEAIKFFGEKVDCYIDGGISSKKLPSTIVDMINFPPKLLRKGPISFSDIKKILHEKNQW
ncbi:MAG: threonylcarbamoyl-AMP synthase [Candidatus Lokiarchaeota archaeon]|nr:threonylcarbamoyl-AMP synthase [Candidatus Lokiarchaeota archaeon]